jgi:DNA-binding response OmpR family regulator
MSALAFIIEDDQDLSTIFADALETVGYKVEQIKDGLLAQQRLNEEVPFLILLDMHLPHVSGADLLTKIRADERFKGTTVILTTADARMAEAYEPMADFVMVKPISFVQLRDLTSRLKPK